MHVVFPDYEIDIDFVFATLDSARDAIADGALNGRELLEAAGLSSDEAAAELARLFAAQR